MSDTSQGQGWWLASDGKWYPPETWTGVAAPATQLPGPGSPGSPPHPGYSQYPAGPGGWMWSPGPVTAVRQTNGLAIAALICACAGVFTVGIGCVLGIVFGFVSRNQIRRSQGTQEGAGLALAGIIVGFSLIALFILAVILIAAFASNDVCTNSYNTYSCSVN